MSFYPLKSVWPDKEALKKEYKAAHKADAFRFGRDLLFVKKGIRIYYLPYSDCKRYFRRVLAVPLKISCCGGVMEVQNIVLCDDTDTELCVVVLKDPRMLDSVLNCLREHLPDAAFGKPGTGKSDD